MGQTSRRLTLAINTDQHAEADEQFSVIINSVSGCEIGIRAVDIAIVNDDMMTDGGGAGGKKSSLLATTDFSNKDDSLSIVGLGRSRVATTPAALVLEKPIGVDHDSTKADESISSGVMSYTAQSWVGSRKSSQIQRCWDRRHLKAI